MVPRGTLHERSDQVDRVRDAGRGKLAATARALILMDCLTIDPFGLINIRIESYMGLFVLMRRQEPTRADGARVKSGEFGLDGESGGAAAAPGAQGASRSTVARSRLRCRAKSIAAKGQTLWDAAGPGRSSARVYAGNNRERARLSAAVERQQTGCPCSTWNTDGEPMPRLALAPVTRLSATLNPHILRTEGLGAAGCWPTALPEP